MSSTITQYVAADERLRLRPFARADVDRVVGWLADDATRRTFLVNNTVPRAVDLITMLEASETTEHLSSWSIDLDDGTHVGLANWKEDLPWFGVFEIEVLLSPSLPRGRGYGLEAHRMLQDHLFTSTEARRVTGHAAEFNPAARAIVVKLGWTVEGTLRGHALLDGVEHDIWVMGMSRAEWELGRGGRR